MGEIVIMIVDIALVACGILAAYYAKQVGGSIGHKSIQLMASGFLLLGVAHILETALLTSFPQLDLETVEISHRVLVLVATLLILIGYARLARFVRS
ncbi:hypothetical protein HY839_00920 [Candidatus Azambacteria bacterium]|nr:hypothetical protein [Candidatus Azambacteria bacterium]